MTIGGNPTAKGAELVLVNGKIRTPAHPSGFTQAAAVSGGVITALCGDDEIRDFIGPFTRVVDLRGRLAIPAFGDAHVHPVQGGLESLRCNLTGLKTRHEYLDAIAAYCETLPRERLGARRRLVDAGLPRRHARPRPTWTRSPAGGPRSCPTATTTPPG